MHFAADVSHVFLHTADDQMYIGGGDGYHSRIYDATVWADANGAGFMLRCGVSQPSVPHKTSTCEVRDSNALYHRNQNYFGMGGRVFTHRAVLEPPTPIS